MTTTNEDSGICRFDEWLSKVAGIAAPGTRQTAPQDVNGVKFLKELITGYMTRPVAVVNNNSIAARSMRVIDITEVAKFVNGREFYLYQLTWYPSYPSYEYIDPLTFEVTSLATPSIMDGYWILRGHVAE